MKDSVKSPAAAAGPRVLHPQAVTAYAPANHVATSNRRIVAPDTVGARHMEVLVGTIAAGGRGLPHAHPTLEQAGIVLAGRAVSTLGGVTRELRAGDVDYIPRNAFHAARVVSEEPLELVVIYAPPYLENPAARVLEPQADVPPPQVFPPVSLPPVATRDELRAGACELVPVLDAARTGARHIAISHLRMGAGAVYALAAQQGAEQLLMVRAGSLRGVAAGQKAAVFAGEWVFVPDHAGCTLQADAEGLDAILVIGRGEPPASG